MNISEGIIEKLASGDQEAFRTVFMVAYPQVRAFSLGLVKNEADADDIAQMVFIKLWTKRAMLAHVRNFNTYLYTITKNTVLNHFAARKALTVDITDAQCEVGDKVEIFGNHTPIEQLSDVRGTIPYEILTSISPRVKRVYFRE